MTPRRFLPGDDATWVLDLIRETFAFMDGRIDPPSSMHRLTMEAIAAQADAGEVWVIDRAACIFLTLKPGALYVGKLAVAPDERGKGLARALIDTAESRARALGLPTLELQARIELTENHAVFHHLGFVHTGATAHPGFDRPTSLTFTKILAKG